MMKPPPGAEHFPSMFEADPRRAALAIGRAFRSGILALNGHRIEAWSFAWQELAALTGGEEADILLEGMADFVEAVDSCAGRPIAVLPSGCPGLCRDECLAVSMVAASQIGACPALKACAYALLRCSRIERPIETADRLAQQLQCFGAVLSADYVCNAAAMLAQTSERPN